MKRIHFLFAVVLFTLTCALPNDAQAAPQEMPISCAAPKPAAQRGLQRPRGDGDVWMFKIVPASNVHWAVGPNWSYPGSDGADPSWGQWSGGDGQMWLSWNSPDHLGAFNIKVTGKISCGSGGPGELIDIEANWFGDVYTKEWQVGDPISGGELVVDKDHETDKEITVVAGSTVWIGVKRAYDVDHWIIQKGESSEEGDDLDDITYSWSHTGGSHIDDPNTPDGRAIKWTAPNTAGDYTVKCDISDKGEVTPPDIGARDDIDIERTLTVRVIAATDGHWEHKNWNLNGAKVHWTHKTSDGKLYPTIEPDHATEILQWVDPVGGTTKPDKSVDVEFYNIEFTEEFDNIVCAFIAKAQFMAHSTVGGPDSDTVSGTTKLTSDEVATPTQKNLSCPPCVLDLLSMNLSPRVELSAQVVLYGNSGTNTSCGSGASSRGMNTMGAGGPAVDTPPTSWTTGYDSYLTIDGDVVTLHNPDGTTKTYVWNGSEYESPVGDYSVLTKTGTDTYVITEQDGSSQTFDIPSGSNYTNPMLSKTQDQFGNTTTLDRNTDGKLTKITDPTGLETTLSYDSSGRLTGLIHMGIRALSLTTAVVISQVSPARTGALPPTAMMPMAW